jgi:antitoxin YobK
MSVKDLQQAFGLIDSLPGADFHGPKDEHIIKKAEQALGIEFPPSYRMFLSRHGCGDVFGVEFYGIIDENFTDSRIPDSIWLTLNERGTAGLPASMILISDTGDGGYYAIDTSHRNSTLESPVVQWWSGLHNDKDDGQIVAEDFGAFMLHQIQEAI